MNELTAKTGVVGVSPKSDWFFYGIAAVLGVGSGVVHIVVQDPLLTALAVLVSTMSLGFARPARPWRWVLIVGALVPIVMTIANQMNYYKDFSRASIYGSVLIILPGVAGAYGGHFGRAFLKVMFAKKP